MRPYFYGLDSILDRTKQALGQGVLQVVENIPEGFESFEFHFVGHIVFIYKLTHGLVLLVLTDRGLDGKSYAQGINKVTYLIESDTYNTVAHFKLLLGSVTQHSLPSNNWSKPNAAIQDIESKTAIPQSPQPAIANVVSNNRTAPSPANTVANNANVISTNTASPNVAVSAKAPSASSAPPAPSIQSGNQTNVQSNQIDRQTGSQKAVGQDNRCGIGNNVATTTNPNKQVSSKTATNGYKLDELLTALNKLSIFTTQYLGKVVVTNYWKSTRPDSSWLSEFELDRSGNITHPKQSAITCTTEQHAQIKLWVSAYVKRCKQVIRNFDQMLDQDCLDEHQKKLLI
jgi:hypothetical protein